MGENPLYYPRVAEPTGIPEDPSVWKVEEEVKKKKIYVSFKVQYLPHVLAMFGRCYHFLLFSILSVDKTSYSEATLSLYFRNT